MYEPKRYELTPSEAMGGLNGFEELAVTRAFGQTIGAMIDSDRLLFARALLFSMIRRDYLAAGALQGAADASAYEDAMTATLDQVKDAFEDEPDDVMPDQPASPAGKGSSSPGD
jgi:hypothetical protein